MEKMLSCDWGTSSFRLRLIDRGSLNVIHAETSEDGIAKIFESWSRSNQPEENRVNFYRRVIQHHIQKIEQYTHTSLEHIPLIISGMASSSIGMMELPYKALPFCLDGSDLNTEMIRGNDDFMHDVLMISGASDPMDTMRGEETQLVGCNHIPDGKTIYIFPGTHSKHIITENGMATACKTYMTGEFFGLLAKKSILASAVEEGRGLVVENNLQSFEKGINSAVESNLLNASFRARTNILFNKLSKQENYYWLSGLLIGTELKELEKYGSINITVVAELVQSSYYKEALRILKNHLPLATPQFEDLDIATIRGQFLVYSLQF